MGDLMRVFIVLLVLCLASAGYSQATFLTAGHLLSKCKSYSAGDEYNNSDERLCSGYIMGIHDTAKTYENLFNVSPLYCEPPRVTSEQMVLAVRRYFLENPEILSSPASPKIIDAFIREFPCE
jgi:hypothetical protein